ncbi:beta-glucosidase [Clostridium saccharoperbutylacetonicum]|uniref:beta-glucosidase n=2 Tax=Clostridium TaxID=1485 RepID=M1MX18_9CLOT|nr:glycoside hydrolase family 3 N-terminal domain-containing protein [Clostridium saccharoperbutylacetonicum]AGF59116.1 periplasmic beta-glucosidase/beta-xylosidase BgxA [Clostridium saccharoperbutylacetonicum N1-4(HMT)]NRT60096.1 beta-glucosidase [Clostridium saccharoperbutylacetonicum]NSB23408.1 beta-glucosidase [Clostridium saccharoperbutylacetonicum]NSB42778.1 beta-glucosidase [Clostridium saccharoperbutylacetonicum]
MKRKKLIANLLLGAVISSQFMFTTIAKAADPVKYTEKEVTDGKTTYMLVTNPNNGKELGYSKNSGVKLIEQKDGNYTYAFKDLNKNGKLDKFEDWRLDSDTRAKDLAKSLTVNQIAGLMLFSAHEKTIEAGLTDAQKKYLSEDNLRAVLNAGSNNTEAAVTWNNQMQAYVESLPCPIPVNFSSDPRSTAGSGDQYSNAISGKDVSLWPSNLGLAATFDTNIMYEFAKDVSAEYRAMGIATALGPQIDLATEPRWLRVYGTFGEDTKLATDMAEAYVDGSQSTYDKDGKDLGWGKDSINCMIKHWPGDGAGEGGRESHMMTGKYAVYPGNNFSEHLKPFTEGGLKLKGKTGSATAVMDSYSIGLDAQGNPIGGQAVGSAYNKEKMSILRDKNKFDGVVCTDWGVTATPPTPFGKGFGMAWGEENKTVDERHYDVLMNGVDMFGGNNNSKPVIAAYNMMVKNNGEAWARNRFEQSAVRLLKLMFNPGLFENPYLNLNNSLSIVGSKEKKQDGYNAQLSSIVMLKNSNSTIKADNGSAKNKKVYIPMTYTKAIKSAFGTSEAAWSETMTINVAKNYFKEVVTDIPVKDANGNITGYKAPDLSDVDLVIVGMSSPNNGGNFSYAGLSVDAAGNKKFYPLSLQYSDYVAKDGRKVSISGDKLADGTKENRSYNGNTSNIYNSYDLEAMVNAKAAIKKTGKNIPIICAMKASNAVCFGEFEKSCDSIVVGFSVSDAALLDVITGKFEPKGLLPIQMPKDMTTVEKQLEDVGLDMECYKDSDGHVYDFAFGLNYSGVINDSRVSNYKHTNNK